jgi:hypothetical protein
MLKYRAFSDHLAKVSHSSKNSSPTPSSNPSKSSKVDGVLIENKENFINKYKGVIAALSHLRFRENQENMRLRKGGQQDEFFCRFVARR